MSLTRDSIIGEIVGEVAESEDKDPDQLPALNEYIDTDALQQICDLSKKRDGSKNAVRFQYFGYSVTITNTPDGNTVFVEKGDLSETRNRDQYF